MDIACACDCSGLQLGSGKIAYKIDRRTGQSWLLRGEEEVAIGKSTPVDETATQKATRLCKNAYTLNNGEYPLSNDLQIRKWVRESKGPLKIFGWEATRIDEETFLVSYSVDRGKGRRGWIFEVNVPAEIVRNVSGDDKLEAQYGIKTVFDTPEATPTP